MAPKRIGGIVLIVIGLFIAYTGYGLDEDYELVEGDWIFEIWYQDEM